jgi:hypothetical protein
MPGLGGRVCAGDVHGAWPVGLEWESARGARSVVAEIADRTREPRRYPSHTAKLVNSFTSMTEAAGLAETAC